MRAKRLHSSCMKTAAIAPRNQPMSRSTCPTRPRKQPPRMKGQSMPPPPDDDQPLLEDKPADDLWRFRPYLMMLARSEFDEALAAKLDASDIVQQSLLEAHQSLVQYRGTTDREMAG